MVGASDYRLRMVGKIKGALARGQCPGGVDTGVCSRAVRCEAGEERSG